MQELELVDWLELLVLIQDEELVLLELELDVELLDEEL
jgi:hypothetical protein